MVETVASGPRSSVGLAFLPDGRMLVTERPGRMRIVARDGKLSPPLAGVPEVFASGQGGLLDVDRSTATTGANQTVYFCYAEPVGAGARTRARTRAAGGRRHAAARRRRSDLPPGRAALAAATISAAASCRRPTTICFSAWATISPRATRRRTSATIIGKIVRIRPDGSVPPDNPFVGKAGRQAGNLELRPPQCRRASRVNPADGKLWEHEHGPRGGDEINIVEKGKNYGWPVIGYGIDYNGAKIHDSTHKDGMEQPIRYWVPSIAPSGMAFYTGDLFPAWRGNLFVGALAVQLLVRLELDGDKVVKEERLLRDVRERIRDVRQGPDGALWLVTDSGSGRILRVRRRSDAGRGRACRPGPCVTRRTQPPGQCGSSATTAKHAVDACGCHSADTKLLYPPPPIR